MTPPPPRRGPRPLPLHLSILGLRHLLAMWPLHWPAGWPITNGGSPLSNGGRQEAARIAAALVAGNHRPEAFRAAVLDALRRDEAAVVAGILAYRRQPTVPPPVDQPAIWAEGGSRLLDYGGTGLPLLVVPSLVNRAAVLDLQPARGTAGSMLRWFAAHGLRPLLLDWGAPGDQEAGFTLTDYVAGRLERAIAAVDQPVVLAGYCMGGLLALAAAQRRPDRVRGLALLATPWDFWAAGAELPRRLAALLPALEPTMAATGTLPVDLLQALFTALDPFGVLARYRGFAALDPAGERGARFVALEDWLNDGIPLAAAVARETLGGWYGANTPCHGRWRIAGVPVDPASLAMPTFIAVPSRDRLVPPASAMALAAVRPGAAIHHAAAGHVGMVAGAQAEAVLWRPMAAWLAGLA